MNNCKVVFKLRWTKKKEEEKATETCITYGTKKDKISQGKCKKPN